MSIAFSEVRCATKAGNSPNINQMFRSLAWLELQTQSSPIELALIHGLIYINFVNTYNFDIGFDIELQPGTIF